MGSEQAGAGLKKAMYEEMVLIRRFEEKLIALSQEQGKLIGMQILAYGQEAVAVGMVKALKADDVMVSNHRSHGHLLAKGADPKALMAEIMGKATGVNKGKSGTLHMAVPEVNALMTTTIVGGGPPVAVGAAFAQQYRGTSNITVVFFGDGAAAEGSVHEAMNLAALWKLPVLFVCENNCWAGAQSLSEHCCLTDITRRAAGYGMPGESVDGNDVEKVFTLARDMVSHCRSGEGPAFMEAKTYRMRGHGEHDHQHYVDKKELETWARLCPVKGLRDRIVQDGLATEEELEVLDKDVEARVEEAVQFASDSPYPLPEEALQDLWVDDGVAQ
ncbi:MAG: thiamine pyrophosphate-dependent dehydrogenase E1 component subunit alpha [Thermodesulfobacteriota bacterium]|nr:thiamine pyrophosphate-dependent dehydrogenase E1 component subunit alpha [Thermodesulfobacteriota bacterium]